MCHVDHLNSLYTLVFHLYVILLKINLFSPWYSWKIAELELSNNHSITHHKSCEFESRSWRGIHDKKKYVIKFVLWFATGQWFSSADNKHVTFLSCTEGLFYETCNKHTSLPIECTIYCISILAIIIHRFVLCDGQISYDGDWKHGE
jgi:hypothetical protein